MDRKLHWENIFQPKRITSVTRYAPHFETSLKMIEPANLPKDARIIDIGCGASTLFDDLLEAGYTNVNVLDISSASPEKIRERVGNRSGLRQ